MSRCAWCSPWWVAWSLQVWCAGWPSRAPTLLTSDGFVGSAPRAMRAIDARTLSFTTSGSSLSIMAASQGAGGRAPTRPAAAPVTSPRNASSATLRDRRATSPASSIQVSLARAPAFMGCSVGSILDVAHSVTATLRPARCVTTELSFDGCARPPLGPLRRLHPPSDSDWGPNHDRDARTAERRDVSE